MLSFLGSFAGVFLSQESCGIHTFKQQNEQKEQFF